MKTLEFTAHYKMGHTLLRCRTTVAPRNLNYIQEVPPEVPEYSDGVNSMVCLANGERMSALDQYDTLSKAYIEAMSEES